MPVEARKTSLGNSRKALPYREPDTQIGRKTGAHFGEVERNSDGFEDYGLVVAQAEKNTLPIKPVIPKKKKKRARTPTPEPSEEEEDEDGEQSMEIVQSTIEGTPLKYFKKTTSRHSSARRISSSALKSLPRSPVVEYDRILSPSGGEGSRSRRSIPRPSSLGRGSVGPEDYQQDDGGGGADDYDEDPPIGNGSFEDYENDQTPTRKSIHASARHQRNGSSRKGKGRAMSEEEEEQEVEEPEQEATPIASSKSKGKGKAPAPREPSLDPDMEDDMAQGLQNEEMQGPYSDEEQEEEAPPAKKEKKKKKKKTHAVGKGKENAGTKVVRQPCKDKPPHEGPLRRSRREHMVPLEYWRLEKRVYGRPEHGKTMVANVKEIIRIPREPVVPLGGKKRKRAKGTPAMESPEPVEPPELVADPEEGWDDETDVHVSLIDWNTKKLVKRRIGFVKKNINLNAAANDGWFFQKIFGDDEFIAAGILLIPPGGKKPLKQTKDNTYIFYVVEGAVNLALANRKLVMATGSSFMVPRGNLYYIENICQRDVKLFFTQARKVEDGHYNDNMRDSRTPSNPTDDEELEGEQEQMEPEPHEEPDEEEEEELPSITKKAGKAKAKAAPKPKSKPKAKAVVEEEPEQSGDEEEEEEEEAPAKKKVKTSSSKPASKAGSKPPSKAGSKPPSKAGSKPASRS